jgi:hypothetical protein
MLVNDMKLMACDETIACRKHSNNDHNLEYYKTSSNNWMNSHDNGILMFECVAYAALIASISPMNGKRTSLLNPTHSES